MPDYNAQRDLGSRMISNASACFEVLGSNRPMNAARNIAMQRLNSEARALGAEGMVGIITERKTEYHVFLPDLELHVQYRAGVTGTWHRDLRQERDRVGGTVPARILSLRSYRPVRIMNESVKRRRKL